MTIREMAEQREVAYFSPYASLSSKSRGRDREEPPCDIRPVYQRDRDRILHSKAFRRLKHKTQVFLLPQGDHYRTRLTHTLEVAQTARTIARALRMNEDLAEAIALGHDLGHKPFGHAGEQALNEICPFGFAHFEQSVRVVELLEKNGKGLNLTWEVRDGIRNHRTSGHPSTLEGKIVRLSDKIAYINHDIDDALRAGILKEASAWDVADTTDTPAILILDCKGVSVSAVAVVKGFLEYETEHHIKGVILNRISPMMYARMKQMIEEQLKVHVYGYVPVVSECVLESRYLGLQIPEEVEKIDEKLEHLARVMEDTVDLDGILELARNVSAMQEDTQVKEHLLNLSDPLQKGIRIAVAHDEAFCFIYPDNLEILKKLGAEIVTFSPIHDRSLPENIQGIVLYGGYPELYAKELSENDSMRESICHAVTLGVPCIAECGGFMYLQERMEGSDGKIYDMAGALFGKSYKTEKLRRNVRKKLTFAE